jgi:hypothetical protein
MEEWKSVNHEELPFWYEISTKGNVRALPYRDRTGYYRKMRYIHPQPGGIQLRTMKGQKKYFSVKLLFDRTWG